MFSKGNIGLGTSEPQERLHVAGNAKVDGKICAAEMKVDGTVVAKSLIGELDGSNITGESIDLDKLVKAVQQALCPVGTILPYAGDTAPLGWILCNGQEGLIEKNKGGLPVEGEFAALFAVIGNRFGTFMKEGIQYFVIPDLRGRFLRGRDGGAKRDPESDLRTAIYPGGATGDAVGSVQEDAIKSHIHTYTRPTSPAAVDYDHGGGQSAFHNGSLDTETNTNQEKDAEGGLLVKETRPKNMYVNYIIKF